MEINQITNVDRTTIQFTTEEDKIETRKVITIEVSSVLKSKDGNKLILINNSEILNISEPDLDKLLSALE